MITWITLIIELIKLLGPIITKIINDPKPNPVAMRETVNKLRGVVGEPPQTKGI